MHFQLDDDMELLHLLLSRGRQRSFFQSVSATASQFDTLVFVLWFWYLKWPVKTSCSSSFQCLHVREDGHMPPGERHICGQNTLERSNAVAAPTPCFFSWLMTPAVPIIKESLHLFIHLKSFQNLVSVTWSSNCVINKEKSHSSHLVPGPPAWGPQVTRESRRHKLGGEHGCLHYMFEDEDIIQLRTETSSQGGIPNHPSITYFFMEISISFISC